MSAISSQFGNLPGIGAAVESYEQAITFGIAAQLKWWNGYISADAVDVGNNPTWRLRPGLLLGLITSSGKWTNYSPTATDGSQVAQAVLAYGLRMQDVLTGVNTTKFYAIIIGGNLLSANILNLDGMARAQMSNRFTFDQNILGSQWFPTPNFVAKTGDYTITSADNFTTFTNAGAGSTAVNFTLPTLANGLCYSFRVIDDASLTVTSAAGNDMVAYNDKQASSVAFSTSSQKIGGGFRIYSNPAATQWIVENTSAGANGVSVT